MKNLIWSLCSLIVLCLSLTTNSNAQSNANIPNVDEKVAQIMERYQIPGAAVGIMKDGKIIHENYYGYAHVQHEVPASENTLFSVYSCTKLMAATAFFKLVEDGKLDLEESAKSYLDHLPDAWAPVKIKHLLSHSSGLADVAKLEKNKLSTEVYTMPIVSEPGLTFVYNQTNFWLLQQILEKVSGQSFGQFVMDQQFNGGSPETIFSSNASDIIKNRATKYAPSKDRTRMIQDHYEYDEEAWSGNGLNMTLGVFMQWTEDLRNDKFLKRETRNLMWSEFEYKDDFIFGHGWGKYQLDGKTGYGFTGGIATGVRYFPEEEVSIVWLTNGGAVYHSMQEDMRRLLAAADVGLNEPNTIAEMDLYEAFNNNASEGLSHYASITRQQPDLGLENVMNALGYEFLNNNKITTAIEIFKLNVKENPDSWNVYDSLGEGYETKGELAKAIEFYKRSVEMNAENTHGIDKIKVIEERIAEGG